MERERKKRKRKPEKKLEKTGERIGRQHFEGWTSRFEEAFFVGVLEDISFQHVREQALREILAREIRELFLLIDILTF